jgi:hypothetical protein
MEKRLRGTLKLCDTLEREKLVERIEGISFLGLPEAELAFEPESLSVSSDIFCAPFSFFADIFLLPFSLSDIFVDLLALLRSVVDTA